MTLSASCRVGTAHHLDSMYSYDLIILCLFADRSIADLLKLQSHFAQQTIKFHQTLI
jgi:hypothetical protein